MVLELALSEALWNLQDIFLTRYLEVKGSWQRTVRRLINRLADLCEESIARMQILVLDLGRTLKDESFCSMMARKEKSLISLLM